MRTSKLEWVVEKGTELGIDTFLFYRATHSEQEELFPRHMERLRTLAIAALKQSGRLYLPSFEIVPNLTSLFVQEALCLFGDIQAEQPIDLKSLRQIPAVLFITGPEKGFSPEEIALLGHKGQGVRLSAHILRAETAPIAAASILGQLLVRLTDNIHLGC